MAQGSRFVAPRFNGPGLWDPRIPGKAYPEPQEGVPYVQGTAGLSGDCGCSGVGKIDPKLLSGTRSANFAALSRSLPGSGAAAIARLHPNVLKMAQRGEFAQTASEGMSTKKKVAIAAAVLVGAYVIYELAK